MPFYEYKCEACEHQFEALQKISDPLLVECPQCSEQQLRKLLSAPAFRLSGGGWYETDFKSGKKKNIAGDNSSSSGSNKPETKSSDSGDKKASTKSDTKKTSSSTS